MTENTLGSGCSGYGGLELGIAQVIPNITTRWVADYEPPTVKKPRPNQTAAEILDYRFPGVPNLGDITRVRWSDTEPVKIVCAGTPCQDVSSAGARAGMRAGTRSGIWSSMVEAIAHHRPTLVVWENVRGALSATADSNVEPCPICMGDDRECTLRALGRVLGDLSELGYDAVWEVVAASDIGAPHRRERVFVISWPADAQSDPGRVKYRDGRSATDSDRGQHPGREQDALRDTLGRTAAPRSSAGTDEDTDRSTRSQRRLTAFGQTAGGRSRADAGRPDRAAVADPDHQVGTAGHGPGPSAPAAFRGGDAGRSDSSNSEIEALESTVVGRIEQERPGPVGGSVPATDTESYGWDEGRTEPEGQLGRPDAAERGAVDWGPFAAAIRRWELVLGRPAPAPTGPTSRGGQALAPAFVEWLMGLEPGWVTQVPGLTRNEMLHALGNGVVPQQAAHALRRLLPHAPEWVRADLGLPPA